jgi:hypothetical protein
MLQNLKFGALTFSLTTCSFLSGKAGSRDSHLFSRQNPPILGLKEVHGSLTRDLVKRQCKSFLGVKTEDVVEVHLSEAAKNDKKMIHRCGAPLKNLLCDLFHPFDHVSELHNKKHGLERTHLKSVAKNNELSSSLSFGRGQKTITLDVIESSEVKFDSTNVEDYVSELSEAKFTPMFLGPRSHNTDSEKNM